MNQNFNKKKFFLYYSGETDLIKKGEGDDIGLLSGTHVMEGSGRMVIVGVGLNSQVGNIMSLLGATADGNASKNKKKENQKPKTITPSASKMTSDLSKQSVQIQDEIKLSTTTSEEQLHSLKLPLSDNENKLEPTKNGQGGMAKLVEDVDEEEGIGSSDSKHKCE